MKKIQVRGKITKGSLSLNSQEFLKLCSLLDSGDCVLTIEIQSDPKTIEGYRAQYFAMRDLVASETGNTKFDIHEDAKRKFLEGGSTINLNEDEWQGFIKNFKSWAFEHFNVYL